MNAGSSPHSFTPAPIKQEKTRDPNGNPERARANLQNFKQAETNALGRTQEHEAPTAVPVARETTCL